MNKIEIFHGSDHTIETPQYSFGNPHNDYGKGFYCTKELNMAKEWACKQNTDGFVNRYALLLDGLNILDLSDGNNTILNWIAMLLKYRTFSSNSEIAIESKKYIIDNFAVDTENYDVIVGYRADDSYFQYAERFVENSLSLQGLNRALHLGRLGKQIVLVSQKSFAQLEFNNVEPVDKTVHYEKFRSRDTKAREIYNRDIKGGKFRRDDIFVMDILREEMNDNDPRIQQIVP